jgi:hypothetical protein
VLLPQTPFFAHLNQLENDYVTETQRCRSRTTTCFNISEISHTEWCSKAGALSVLRFGHDLDNQLPRGAGVKGVRIATQSRSSNLCSKRILGMAVVCDSLSSLHRCRMIVLIGDVE